MTPFVIAINKEKYSGCIVEGDPVESYRNYYRTAKKDMATWKSPAVQPEWF